MQICTRKDILQKRNNYIYDSHSDDETKSDNDNDNDEYDE